MEYTATDYVERMIEAAKAEAMEVHVITRVDGTSYRGIRGYGAAVDGAFRVYVVLVTQRTRAMREHYRVTFYLLRGEVWKRTSRDIFEAALRQQFPQ